MFTPPSFARKVKTCWISASLMVKLMFLPLYFFFCATRGSVSSALNLIGAQFQKATIDMSLKSLCSVIENGDEEDNDEEDN